jgi:hypothetical protein
MAPKIVTARQIGLSFTKLFGELGPELYLTGHHTGGPKDTSLAHAIELDRRYHGEHAAKGWGGIGYHFNITRKGVIVCLRPTLLKGTHVGLHNSNNVGVMCHGTTGDRPTPEQARSLLWLERNAHTAKMPAAHRTDRSIRSVPKRGHNDWPGHGGNECPGTHKPMYISGGHSL